MFLLWEHTVLSLFNYIVFVWLFLLVVLRLSLPDRPARLTLNKAGFKVRRETRTAAPDWLDEMQARVTRDTHSSPELPPPCSHIRASPGATTALPNTSAASSSSPREIPPGTAQPPGPSLPHFHGAHHSQRPGTHRARLHHIHHLRALPIPSCPAPHLLSPTPGCPSGPKSLLPTGRTAFIFLCPPCYFKGIPEDAVRLGCGLVGLFVFVLEVL